MYSENRKLQYVIDEFEFQFRKAFVNNLDCFCSVKRGCPAYLKFTNDKIIKNCDFNYYNHEKLVLLK